MTPQNEEQKKWEEPPPVHGSWQLLPLPNTFVNGEEYKKIFIPLMLQELWSSISADHEEKVGTLKEEVIPVCIQELCKDPSGCFNIFRFMGLLTDQESRRDLGIDGTFVQVST